MALWQAGFDLMALLTNAVPYTPLDHVVLILEETAISQYIREWDGICYDTHFTLDTSSTYLYLDDCASRVQWLVLVLSTRHKCTGVALVLITDRR